MQKAFSPVALLAGCGLLAASALGSVAQTPPANTFRMSLSVDIDHVDPALAHYVSSWAIEYATGAMLFNYPDEPAPRGARLVPEVAAGLPTISKDGRTYTLRLKRTYRFSNGRRVTASSFVTAFRRARSPRMSSPAATFLRNVEAFAAVTPYMLKIRLKRPAGDLLARLAMPFFMAIPPGTRIDPDGIPAPVVSAGPYFIREWTRTRRIILERNRFYRGPRPHRVARIEIDIGLRVEAIKLNIDRGATDTGEVPPAAHAELARRYGVKRRSPGRYFVNPSPAILYLAMNHDRPLFGGPTPLGNLPLKKAVNYAIDRTRMLWQGGAFAGVAHDQLLPRTMPGFRNVAIYPRRSDLEKARALARNHLRGGEATMFCGQRPPRWSVCQIVQASLRQIGLHVDIGGIDKRTTPSTTDLILEGWHSVYFDPYDFLFVVQGRTIERPDTLQNLSRFNHPGYNRKFAAAASLTGAKRYAEFGALDVDLMRNAAPVAVYGIPNDRHYVSARTGCYHYHPVYGYDLPAICLRP